MSIPDHETGRRSAAPVRWASTPPRTAAPAPRVRPRPRAAPLIAALALAVLSVLVVRESVVGEQLPAQAALTLVVFAVAVWMWIFSPLDDTYVALGAALILVATGVIDDTELFESLGEDTVWLLLTAFVIAAGVTASGLAARVAGFVVRPRAAAGRGSAARRRRSSAARSTARRPDGPPLRAPRPGSPRGGDDSRACRPRAAP